MNNNDGIRPSFPTVLSDQKSVLVSQGGEPAPGTCAPFRPRKGPRIRGRFYIKEVISIKSYIINGFIINQYIILINIMISLLKYILRDIRFLYRFTTEIFIIYYKIYFKRY